MATTAYPACVGCATQAAGWCLLLSLTGTFATLGAFVLVGATVAGLMDPKARCLLPPLNCLWAGQLCLPGLGGEWDTVGPRSPLHILGCAQFPSQTLSTQNATLREVPKEKPRAPFPLGRR